ncbi:MAG: carboxymuconolactone decarboxylase family protein [Parvibaculales bacterium]
MAHLPIAPQEKLDALAEELSLSAAIMGFEANSLKIMAHRPEILRGFLALMAPLMGPGALLDAGLRQMVAYIASAAAGCRYCQAHTAHGAHEKGVTAEKIDRLWAYETDPAFTAAERAALALAQAAASVPNAAAPSHFEAARAHFSDAEIAEIIAVVAAFGFLNRWNDTLATNLEDSPLAFAESHLAASGWSADKHG